MNQLSSAKHEINILAALCCVDEQDIILCLVLVQKRRCLEVTTKLLPET